ncbi:MAG: hypothetical protein EOP45_20950, partial [Sphingobacteriaceae bacterium]
MIPLTTHNVGYKTDHEATYYIKQNFDNDRIPHETKHFTVPSTEYTVWTAATLLFVNDPSFVGVTVAALVGGIIKFCASSAPNFTPSIRYIRAVQGLLIVLLDRSFLLRYQTNNNSIAFSYHYVFIDGFQDEIEQGLDIMEKAREDIDLMMRICHDPSIDDTIQDPLIFEYAQCAIEKLAQSKNLNTDGKSLCDLTGLVHEGYLPDQEQREIFSREKLKDTPAMFLFEHDKQYFDIVSLGRWGIAEFRRGSPIRNPITRKSITAKRYMNELLDRTKFITQCRQTFDAIAFKDAIEAINEIGEYEESLAAHEETAKYEDE